MVNALLETPRTAGDGHYTLESDHMLKKLMLTGSTQAQQDQDHQPPSPDPSTQEDDTSTIQEQTFEVSDEDHENESEELIRNQMQELCGDVKVQYTKSIEGVEGTKNSTDKPPLILETWKTKRQALHAMEFTSHYNEKKEREKTTVTITSEGLRKLIKETISTVLEHVNSGVFDGPVPVTVQTDNALVIHSLDRLTSTAKATADTQAGAELHSFIKHLERYERATLQALAAAHREGQVEYDSLWTLFPPGSEVVATPFQGSHQIFTVDSHGPSIDGKHFQLVCWAYDWDGQGLVRTAHEFVVQRFTGMKKVTELQCYPLSFFRVGEEGPEELRQRLIKRGKIFERFCKRDDGTQGARPTLWRCDNFATARPDRYQLPDLSHLLDRQPVAPKIAIIESEGGKSSPVIIDPGQYVVHAPKVGESSLHLGTMVPRSRKACECNLCTMHGSRTVWDNQFAKGRGAGLSQFVDPEVSSRLYSHLPPRLLGFVVDQKSWGQLQVEHISEEDTTSSDSQSSTAWMELALEKEHKRNIERMVTNHFKMSEDEATKLRIRDPVKDKGEGLVILLHGLPGLGKTMTAEGLAQTTNRRLIRIDATDFHYSEPSQVSRVFRKYFECAHQWGTLLLLDEADVFLQSRKARDLAQNALVSVLLRELEYFKGVLIMTTNRVMTMDTAMESRIHYTVKFRDLDENSITQIFKTFAKQLNEDNCREEDKQDILEFVKMEASDLVQKNLTGRDIRNILTTAQLLDWPWITHKNFRAILRNTGNFRQDMAARANAEHASNAAPRERNAY